MQVKRLNLTHSDYDHDALELYEALYEGGEEFDEVKRDLMPMNAFEPADLYNERMGLATYENHVGPLVDLVTAWLFSRPPVIEGIPPEWTANVDRRGTSLAMFVRDRFTEALKYARDYTWINLPTKREDVTNLADQERLGLLTPFVVALGAEEVRDWGYDDVGELRYVLARTEHCDRASIEADPVETIRWTWIDPGEIRRWSYQKTEAEIKDTTEVDELARVTHGFATIPVAAFDLPAGLHILAKLRDPAISHLRTMNDYDWKLHRDAHNTLIVESDDDTGPPVLGPGHYTRIPAGAKAYYAAPNTAIYDAFAAREDQKREGIYRLVQAMAQAVSGKSTQQAASAASKALDWQSLSIMLTAYADHVRAYLLDLCRIVAVPLGVPADKVTIGGLSGWQEDEISKMLDDFVTSQGVVKSAAFHRALAKSIAARMMPGGTEAPAWPEVDKELEEADYSAPEPAFPALPPLPGDPVAP